MSGYIGTQPVPQATQTRETFTATASQTSFATGGYQAGYIDVFLNGVKLVDGTDFTATNGSDVVLTTGAASGDTLEVVAYTAFEAANVTGATDFTVTGSFTSRGIDDNATSTAMTLDSSGNVLVGTTQTFPAFNNVVGCEVGGFGQISASRDGAEAMQLNRKTSDGNIALFQKDGSTVGSIGTGLSGGSEFGIKSNTGELQLATSYNSNTVTWDGSQLYPSSTNNLGASSAQWQDLYLSGGVYLGGTGAANKLDDYEEGTWTPVITASPINPTVTYTTQKGAYTKVGRLVTLHWRVQMASHSGGSGNVLVSGLPFAISGSGQGNWYENTAIEVQNLQMDTYSVKYVTAEAAIGTSYFNIMGQRNNNNRHVYAINELSQTAGFSGSISYITDL